MRQRCLTAKDIEQSSSTMPARFAALVALLMLLASQGVADDLKSNPYDVAKLGLTAQFGMVEASGLRWLHLSSRHGDLPVPTDFPAADGRRGGRSRQGRAQRLCTRFSRIRGQPWCGIALRRPAGTVT